MVIEFERIQEQLSDLAEQLRAVQVELGLLRQDVRTILEHLPMQMIPSDPTSEVQ
jgi:hypothetical protein